MKDQSLLEEIQDAAEAIQSYARYLEELNDDVNEPTELADGEGTYEMRVTLSITSHERTRTQANQHCRKVAGSLREDSAIGRFDIVDTQVKKLDSADRSE